MDTARLVNQALQDGIVDTGKVEAAREEKGRLSTAGEDVSLWEALVRLGHVNRDQERDLEGKIDTGQFYNLQLEGYTVTERLGSGGMGDVYIGRDAEEHKVAFKLLPRRYTADPEYVARFRRESRLHLRAAHEHLVEALASGEHKGRPYLVMELVRGPSLKERIRNDGALTENEALVVLDQMGRALRALQGQGIVHRDVKPANIILGPARPDSDEPFCCKLCDFGLAKGSDPEDDEDQELTLSGVALGTPHYMSPEQAAGQDDLDFRTDIYSLGATIYHALMGKTLFSGKTSAIVMYKQVTEEIDVSPLRERDLDPDLVELLGAMLRKDPDQRPESWEAVLERVKILLSMSRAGLKPADVAISGSDLIGPTPFAEVLDRGHPLLSDLADRRRAVIRLVGGVVALVLLLAGLILWLLPDDGADRLGTGPDGFAAALDEAGRDLSARRTDAFGTARLELYPGSYHEPWRFTAAHAGLVVDAGRAGVEFDPAAGAGPAILVDAGCTGLRVVGLRWRPQGLSRIVCRPGSTLTLVDCRFNGDPVRIEVDGAQLRCRDCSVTGSVAAAGGSRVEIDGCLLGDDGGALRGDDSALRVRRSRLRGGEASAAVIAATGGSVVLRYVAIDGGGAATGLSTRSGRFATLRLVRIAGVERGWSTEDTPVPLLRDLRIEAGAVGLRWSGEHAAAWDWRRVTLEAPVPQQGPAGWSAYGNGPAAADFDSLPGGDG